MKYAVQEALEEITSKGANLDLDFLEKVLTDVYEDGFAEGDEQGRRYGYDDGFYAGKAEADENNYDDGHQEGYREGYASALEEMDNED